jgi:uncharacterized protein (UPF0332 family)
MMNLEEMVEQHILEKRAASPEEISNLLETAERKLSESLNNTISNETRLVQAYHVILTCATIALRAMGYRARSTEGKHYYSINTLRLTLNKSTQEVRYYQDLRKRRHEDIYEGLMYVSKIEMKKATFEAQKLFDELKSWLDKNYHNHIAK